MSEITTLPTVDFFGRRVSRLILGDNPFNGHSYIPDFATGIEMNDFYTEDKIIETLFNAEKAGINTILPLACSKMFGVFPRYFETGGKMQIIFQPYPAESVEENFKKMLEWKPIAIYHQGTTTDYLTETDQTDIIKKNIAVFKSAGIPIGLGTHVPETIIKAEEENWGIDFYMASLYNARINRRGEQSGFITGKTKADLFFYPDDRFLMYEIIKKVNKPFIAFKIFAGGQIFTGKPEREYEATAENMLREVYANIKPNDIAAVGVFQRDKNLIAQNAALVKKILSSN